MQILCIFSVVDEKPYHLNTLTSVRLVSGKMLMESVRWKVDSVKCKVGGIFMRNIYNNAYARYLYIFIYPNTKDDIEEIIAMREKVDIVQRGAYECAYMYELRC